MGWTPNTSEGPMKHRRIFHNSVGALALILSLCTLLTNVRADAPAFSWVQRSGGTNREYATRVAVDPVGNSYIIGKFPGPSTTIGGVLLTNGGLFIAKYDPVGNVSWARQVGPPELGQISISGNWVPQVGADN